MTITREVFDALFEQTFLKQFNKDFESGYDLEFEKHLERLAPGEHINEQTKKELADQHREEIRTKLYHQLRELYDSKFKESHEKLWTEINHE